MNKKYAYILVVMLLLIFSVYLFFNKKNTTLKNADFSVENTEEISQIHIYSNKDTIYLHIDDKVWRVNDLYDAKQKEIYRLLKAMSLLQVKAPVMKSRVKTISKELLENGIKVNIFKEGHLIRSYYTIEKTAKGSTYMMMSETEMPFIVEIPAFKGSIIDLFATNLSFWRTNTMLRLKSDEIKKIIVKKNNQTEASFIINKESGKPVLYNEKGNVVANMNMQAFNQYITYFSNILCKKWVFENKKDKLDLLRTNQPESELIVESFNNKWVISLYKPINNFKDEKGVEFMNNPDLIYAVMNRSELAIVNALEFDLLFKDIVYFIN